MESLQLSWHNNIAPEKLFKDWLNSKGHSLLTGSKAKIKPMPLSKFSAWDSYISGRIIEVESNYRILHSWRTSEFRSYDLDSLLELIFHEEGNGCLLILKHWNLPSGTSEKYLNGWLNYYQRPMNLYYNSNNL